MAACSGGALELKWATEKATLRHECQVELKYKLLEVAQEQFLPLNDDRKILHNPHEDETLLDLKQKLDAIALSGRRLSQVFMNSLVSTFVHRIATAAIQCRKEARQSLATEEPAATQGNSADCQPTSGCNNLSGITTSGMSSQAPDRFSDTISAYPPHPHMAASVEDGYSPTRVRDDAGFNPLEGILVERVLQELPQDETSGYASQTQLAALVQQRIDLDRQASEERNLFAKRSAYMRECRVAAEKEKEMAGEELAAAMLAMVAAGKERAVAASCRAAALDELKRENLLRERRQPKGSFGAGLGPQALKATKKTIGCDAPTKSAAELQLSTPPHLSLPSSACPGSPNLAHESPDDTESNGHNDKGCTTPVAIYADKPTCLKDVTELHENDDPQGSAVISHPEDEVATMPRTLENPIGPYIRPPMPLEDMLKCVRCLFGKDKSLKTGNRARAFLGVPWSEIVSFDPDVLLRRGVLGIKEGSTGMASRLRMMTIIESALSNQNDDTIPAEVWERPTHFCENCQKRYPITVSSNEAVVPYEEAVQGEVDDIPSQVSREGNPKAQDSTGSSNSKGKRNRKRLRATRQTTHIPR